VDRQHAKQDTQAQTGKPARDAQQQQAKDNPKDKGKKSPKPEPTPKPE
jgi:hypothetical protein